MTIIGNGVLTFEKLRLIWVPPVLAAVLGGYLTAWIAPHSGVRHAMAVAGIFVLLIALLALRAAEPPIQTAMTSLALTVCILLGAIGRDWQLHRSRGYAA